MNGKYIGVIVGAVVAIMLVGGALMPVIDNVTTGEGRVKIAEGNQNIYYDYYADATDLHLTLTFTVEGEDVVITAGDSIYKIPIDISERMLYFRSEKIMIYTYKDSSEDFINSLTCSVSGGANRAKSITVTIDGTSVSASYVKYADSTTVTTNVFTAGWVIVPNANGDYSSWLNTEPNTEQVNSQVIGSRTYNIALAYDNGEVQDNTGWRGILLTIPVVLLASLLVAVAVMAFRRDY